MARCFDVSRTSLSSESKIMKWSTYIAEKKESLNLFIFFAIYVLDFIILLSLDNDVLKTLKRRAMFHNILSQNFVVECFTKSLLIRIIKFYLKFHPLHTSDSFSVLNELPLRDLS